MILSKQPTPLLKAWETIWYMLFMAKWALVKPLLLKQYVKS